MSSATQRWQHWATYAEVSLEVNHLLNKIRLEHGDGRFLEGGG